jgi:hypothetical protein
MFNRIIRWFIPLLVLGFFSLPMAYAQRGRIQVEEPPTTQSFAFAYTVAFLATIIVLVILCAPSRKAWRD